MGPWKEGACSSSLGCVCLCWVFMWATGGYVSKVVTKCGAAFHKKSENWRASPS